MILAATAGTAGAGTAIRGRRRRPTDIPLPKVAIVFSQRQPRQRRRPSADRGSAGPGSRALTNPIAGTIDDHATKSPDGRLVLFQRETRRGRADRAVDLANPASSRSSIRDAAPLRTARPTSDLRGPSTVARALHSGDGSVRRQDDAASAAALLGQARRKRSAARIPEGVDPTYRGGDSAILTRRKDDGLPSRHEGSTGVVKYAIFKSRPDGSHAQQMTPWDLNADRPSVSPARSGPTAGLVAFETYGGGRPGAETSP